MFSRRKEEAPKVQEKESGMEKFCKHNKQIGNCDQCMMSESEALDDAAKVQMAARAHKGFSGYDPEGKLEPSSTDLKEGERWIREGIIKPDQLDRAIGLKRNLETEIERLQRQLASKQELLNDIKRDPRNYLNKL